MEKPKITMKVELETDKAVKKIEEVAEKMKELNIPNIVMNISNINAQLLAIEAAVTKDRTKIYQAAMMDPHTAAELSIDDIIKMCDEMIEAHGDFMKDFNK